MSSERSARPHGRRAAGLVFGLFVIMGLAVVFGGTITRSTDIEAVAAQTRAEIEALEARVAAGEAEVAFLETDAFIQQQARALGFGERGETVFSLPEDAPAPESIRPIGSGPGGAGHKAPFEAWMELLFGA